MRLESEAGTRKNSNFDSFWLASRIVSETPMPRRAGRLRDLARVGLRRAGLLFLLPLVCFIITLYCNKVTAPRSPDFVGPRSRIFGQRFSKQRFVRSNHPPFVSPGEDVRGKRQRRNNSVKN